MWIDNDFPRLLGAELYRPDAAYIAKYVTRPLVVHDFTRQPGESVQLDRYNYWEDSSSFTESARERNDTQTIGTANSRDITKDKVIVTLREFTGPADVNDPNAPSTFKIPMRVLRVAQRNLWQYGVQGFHESIGSLTLFRDFRKWEDRVYINKMLEAATQQSSSTQGGYYNPDGVADGGTYANGPQKFDVTTDLLTVVEQMRSRNVPTFEDGTYCCLAHPRFIKHLRANSDFREVARYPGSIPVTSMLPGNMSMAPAQIPFVGSPNSLIFGGSGYQQASFLNGVPSMPTGFIFEGVRFFECTNLPTASVSMTYTALTTDAESTDNTGAATRNGYLGIFFGPQAIGVGLGGPGPEVLLNNNDDFQRFIIAIWRLYSGYALLNRNFITVARTYGK